MPRLPGNSAEKLSLIRALDARRFPELVADVLEFGKGHTEARVTDGPGDGKRDVVSFTPKGHLCFTQCKYHKGSRSVGSEETDQIIVALNKMGAKHGVFATTGRISPQAKREYLDNFPDYQLEWYEGQDLVDAVLGNPLLSAI